MYSKQLVRDLSSWGCGPQKTQRLTYPVIAGSLDSDFILGLFDGDGCITFSPKGQPDFTISGCKRLLGIVQAILIARTGVKKTKLVELKGCFRLAYMGTKNVTKIARFLHRHDVPCLDRKKGAMLKYL